MENTENLRKILDGTLTFRDYTEEETALWLAHPVTRSYFQYIREEIRKLEELLSSGRTMDVDNPSKTQTQTAEVIGGCRFGRRMIMIRGRERHE